MPFWSYYSPGRLDQNKTIMGRTWNAVCRIIINEVVIHALLFMLYCKVNMKARFMKDI